MNMPRLVCFVSQSHCHCHWVNIARGYPVPRPQCTVIGGEPVQGSKYAAERRRFRKFYRGFRGRGRGRGYRYRRVSIPGTVILATGNSNGQLAIISDIRNQGNKQIAVTCHLESWLCSRTWEFSALIYESWHGVDGHLCTAYDGQLPSYL